MKNLASEAAQLIKHNRFLLLCDDAPQFKRITEILALCWVHEGRPYKKLNPAIEYHVQLLDKFLTRFWVFYHQLDAYRLDPTPAERERLVDEFDQLFSTVTGYEYLDERIAKTKAKKEELLPVLDHPEIPLHNNEAELGARQQKPKQNISFGPRTKEGAKIWDTGLTLVATAYKLEVNILDYICDRISRTNQMPSLANLIEQQAAESQLGQSFFRNYQARPPPAPQRGEQRPPPLWGAGGAFQAHLRLFSPRGLGSYLFSI